MQAIDAYLQSPPPGYALLIEGPWGVGKSFFWSQKARELKGLTAITFSAAGLNTYDDLERALFQASIKGFGPSAAIETGAVLGRALLRFVNIQPDDIKLKAEATGGKTVVCIDDVERFAGDFRTLFGFIVNLIDENGVHCILVADEKRALSDMKEYGVSKERIVGKTVRLRPDLRAVIVQIINGFASEQSRSNLKEGIDDLIQIIDNSGVRNLRTVRFYLTELDEVLRNLSQDEARVALKSSLPSALAFAVFAVAINVDNTELVVRAFSQDQLGMALAMHEHLSAKSEASRDDGMSRLAELLTELRLYNEVDRWPRSRALLAMIGGGDCDYGQLADEFELRAPLVKQGAPRPIEVLRRYYEHSDDVVLAAIPEVRDIVHVKPAHLAELFDAFDTLYFFSQRGVFEPTPQEWTKEVLTALEDLARNPNDIASNAFEPWVDHLDDNRRAVLEACQSVAAMSEEFEKTKRREAALQALIIGLGEMPDATEFEIFGEVEDPEALFHSIRQAGMPAVVRFRRFFSARMRIQNSPDFIGGDRDGSLRLSDCIVGKIPTRRPMPILDAELIALADTLRRFAAFVDEWTSRKKAS